MNFFFTTMVNIISQNTDISSLITLFNNLAETHISNQINTKISTKIIWSVSYHNLPKCARFFLVVTQTANNTTLWDLIICVIKLTKYNRYLNVKKSLYRPEQALRKLKLPNFKTVANWYSFLLDAESKPGT
jgi:hypothetical protein